MAWVQTWQLLEAVKAASGSDFDEEIESSVLHRYAMKTLETEENSQDTIARHDEKKKNLFFSRLAMALIGGFALIVPMLIMTLHDTRLTTLLTTSVFVFAVAVGLAWKMEDAKNQEIIAATAAYAAVLVVFVGTGTPSSA